MFKRTLVYFVLMLAISGCLKTAPAVTPTVTPLPAATSAPGVFPTLPPVTSAPAASPTPFTSFTVKPQVDNLKLRVNAGFLFDAIRLVHQTDILTVLGAAPGGEWIYVQAADGTEGWVFRQLLVSAVDLRQIPLREPKEVVLIKGRVTDASGAPIRGVAFGAASAGQTGDTGNNAVTDANGEFYFFLPKDSSGTWTISYAAIGCDSNVWSDATCATYKTGYTGVVEPNSASAILPQISPLSFTWK